eukprot:gene2125-3935_t
MACSTPKRVCKHCVLKELDCICDHLSNMPFLNENVYNL